MKRFSNIIGLDDAPFDRLKDETVPVVGAVFADLRLDGVCIFKVRRDGDDATRALIKGIEGSRFMEHIQLVMLQGIAFAGFNVVDVPGLSNALKRPVLVVARRAPNMEAIKRALLERVPNGRKKLSLIEALGPMEPSNGVFVQRYGLSMEEAHHTLERFSINGLIPEPIRVAHLIAGALTRGESTGHA